MNIKDKIIYAILEGTWPSPIYVAMGADSLVVVEIGGQEDNLHTRIEQFTQAPVRCDKDALRPVLDQLREFLYGKRLKIDLPVDFPTFRLFSARFFRSLPKCRQTV